MKAKPTRRQSAAAWLRWAAARIVRGPGVLAGLAHLVLLFATFALWIAAWLALANRPPADPLLLFLPAILWLPPAAYLALWQLQSFASLRLALRGAAATTIMSFAGAFGTLALAATGLLAVGMMAIAILVVGPASVAAIAESVAKRDAADAGPEGGAGHFAHTAGLMVFYLGMFVAVLIGPNPPPLMAITVLTAITLPHALLAWSLRGPGRPLPPMGRRAAALALLAWAVPVPWLGPFWPLDLPGSQAPAAARPGAVRPPPSPPRP